MNIYTIVFYIYIAYFVEAGVDYYNILGLQRSATKEEIKRAYKRLSVKFHPDKNKGDEGAKKKFVEISNAYEILSDEKKKDLYDTYGEEGLKRGEGPGSGFNDPFDIFRRMAGFGGSRGEDRGSEENKGPSLQMELLVDLKELFLGKVLEVELDKYVTCHKCHGSGAKSSSDVKTCTSCNGRGVKIIKQQIAPGMYSQMQTQCNDCGGKGKMVKAKCPVCNGKKIVRDLELIDVAIDRGMSDGSTIVFPNAADNLADHVAGDIVFVVKTAPHPLFVRRGNNLYIKETISLVEALNGFEHQIKHLDDQVITIKRTVMTPPGYVQIIKGQGMPIYDRPTERGELFVEYNVLFPTKKLTEQEKQIVVNLFGGSTGDAYHSPVASSPQDKQKKEEL